VSHPAAKSAEGGSGKELASLFARRLLFLVGKGGVGKSTVALALGLVAARRGKRVLVVSLDLSDRSRTVAGLTSAGDGTAFEVRPGLFRQNVDGKSALEEYLQLVVPVRRVLKAVFDSRVYQYFVAAAPGLKELMAIGKIWYEVDRGKWDLVIVDSPATGHALQYLRMPKTAYETFTTGLVHREAKRVWDLLSNASTTAICAVTVAEELPVNETVSICGQIRGELDLPRGCLFVNRFHSPQISAADVVRARGSWRKGSGAASDALCEAAFAAAEEEVSWGALNERYRARLATETGWPLIVLPFLFREEFGFADVELLAEIVDAEMTPAPKARRKDGRK
jgi:anion-transporting  ArsA/GET3 family ATPase